MMAEGCINTHMARLLGAPPLLDYILREFGGKFDATLNTHISGVLEAF